ncbi:MAG: GAF domain-containing protein [Bacillaceae bacterium]|nr:GAF domain-containing protein [Bacillaceae bacterium]
MIKFDMKLVIPLIIDSELFGFIISNGKIINAFEEDDFHILNALMRLFNNALENSRHFEDLKKSNAILDQKLFNLFIINQSTKVLLSELDIDQLTATATDVFSEVSGSQVTTLGIYDELTEKVKLASYRNVRSFTTYKADF